MIEEKIIGTPPKEDNYASSEVLEYLNKKANRGFDINSSNNLSLVNRLIEKGYEYTDIILVIDIKVGQWKKVEKMKEYLRPTTLFDLYNFNTYIEEVRLIQKKELHQINSFVKPAV